MKKADTAARLKRVAQAQRAAGPLKATRAARVNGAPAAGRAHAVYVFGGGKADGRADMKQLLGGKGANLAEMTNLGVPVPPGLTITTAACLAFYELGKRWPEGLEAELVRKLRWLESVAKKGFGDPRNPLLVSVRSGAPVSMPGMMDTILNLGLNEQTVRGLAERTRNPRFAYDAYRRFIQMFGNVVLGIEHTCFEEPLERRKRAAKVHADAELPPEQLKGLVVDYQRIVREGKGIDFPQDPMEQLRQAINAVFASWHNERARVYRRLNNIPDTYGTAVNVQSMVFGNMGRSSLTGVCFTRDPSTGDDVFYGEYLVNAQGEDVVAGIRTPTPIAELKHECPKLYDQLYQIGKRLERYFEDVQDMEFTAEEGRLYVLQTRTGKRTARAAVTIATDFVKEGLLLRDEALLRINSSQIDQLLHPTISPEAQPTVIAKGLPASPGAAVGKVVFTAPRAVELAEDGMEQVILVRAETSPEDIEGIAASQGILTARGGMTCLAGNTLLLTPEGFRSAAELFEAIEGGARPLLLAFDHRAMHSCWRRATAAGCRVAPTVSVQISQTGRASQNTLELTADHKMFTIATRRLIKKPLAECVRGQDFLCVVDRLPAGPGAMEEPMVSPYLIGALLTDDCIRLWDRKGSVPFTQQARVDKTAMLEAVQVRFRDSFGDGLTSRRQRTPVGVLRGRRMTGTVDDSMACRRQPTEQLAQIAGNLALWILRLPTEETVLEFLAGVADGDGAYIGKGRLHLSIGHEARLAGVIIACLRLGIVPQVASNRTMFHVQIVERIEDILLRAHRVGGALPARRTYGSKLFGTRALFEDVVGTIDRQGCLGAAVTRNGLYSAAAIRSTVLPHCHGALKQEVERLISSGVRMVRATQVTPQGHNRVYNFEVLAEDELDKNFVAFSRQYSPLLVSNSHAAVVGRGMGKCCVVGCNEITVDEEGKSFKTAGGTTVKELDPITLNGATGEVMLGAVPLVQPQLTESFKQLLEWADQTRRLGVRANADTPQDARLARGFGAEGIGLCRTEHMFFGEERLPVVREMIMARDTAARRTALAKLLPFQKQDFLDIFEAMEGLPVTIRLLDPPLHEFLPNTPEDQDRVARQLDINVKDLRETVANLHELNPMLGHRGCRLGVTYPEINEMQAQAIFEAACELVRERLTVLPEVMVPLVGIPEEFRSAKRTIDEVARRTMERYHVTVQYLVGTMIEVPRAALVADVIAQEAEFFSFGTNDLTQMTFGFSRDDVGKFLPQYLKANILAADPFMKLDQDGVGALIRIGVQKGRAIRKDLKVGICGEHGGDPSSIEFCHRVGMNYVSCSPYRVPVARLAAAQAALKEKKSSR